MSEENEVVTVLTRLTAIETRLGRIEGRLIRWGFAALVAAETVRGLFGPVLAEALSNV